MSSSSTEPNSHQSSPSKPAMSSPPPAQANKILLIIISAVCFILLIILMMMSGNQHALALDERKLLVTQNGKVQVANIQIQEQYSKPRTVYGQIESVQQSDIGFELGGALLSTDVVEGDTVKQGDVLATLDTARLLARKNELQSALSNAQANATLAKLSQRRVAELVRNKLEPQQRLDEAQAQLDVANAQTSEASARLSSIDVDISKAQLQAPFDGQIVTQYVDAGTILSAGQAVFSILAKTTLEARFGLPEDTAFGLVADNTYLLSVQGEQFPAKAKSVAKQRNLATRTIDAIFSVDIDDLSAKQRQLMVSGDLVSLSVDITQPKTGAWVPISSLASAVRGMWTLYVVSSSNEIETRLVSIEFADESRAFVSGAISSGDRFVIAGIHRLTPGQKVNEVAQVTLDQNGQLSGLLK